MLLYLEWAVLKYMNKKSRKFQKIVKIKAQLTKHGYIMKVPGPDYIYLPHSW